MIIHRLLCLMGVHHWTRKVTILSYEPVEIGRAWDQCDVCGKRADQENGSQPADG